MPPNNSRRRRCGPVPARHLLHRTADVPTPPHRTAETPVPTSCHSILDPHSVSLIPSKACPGPRSGSLPWTRSGAGIHGPAVPIAPAFDTSARLAGRSKSLPPPSTIATGSGSRSKPLSPGSAKPSQPEPTLGCGSSAAIQRRAIHRGTIRSAAAARPKGDHVRGSAPRRSGRQSSNTANILPRYYEQVLRLSPGLCRVRVPVTDPCCCGGRASPTGSSAPPTRTRRRRVPRGSHR